MKPVKQLLHWTTVLHGLFLKAFRKPLRKNSSAFHFLNWIMTSRIFHLPSAWWNRRQLDWGCFWIFTDRLIPCLCQKSTLPCLRLPTLMRAGAKNKKASKGPSWNGLLAIPKDVIPSQLRPICSWSTSCSLGQASGNGLLDCMNFNEFNVKNQRRTMSRNRPHLSGNVIQKQTSVWWPSLRCVIITTIRSAKVELERAENKIRRLQLTCWKNRFCAEVKYAGRWLQERDACAEVNIRTCRPTCPSPGRGQCRSMTLGG